MLPQCSRDGGNLASLWRAHVGEGQLSREGCLLWNSEFLTRISGFWESPEGCQTAMHSSTLMRLPEISGPICELLSLGLGNGLSTIHWSGAGQTWSSPEGPSRTQVLRGWGCAFKIPANFPYIFFLRQECGRELASPPRESRESPGRAMW